MAKNDIGYFKYAPTKSGFHFKLTLFLKGFAQTYHGIHCFSVKFPAFRAVRFSRIYAAAPRLFFNFASSTLFTSSSLHYDLYSAYIWNMKSHVVNYFSLIQTLLISTLIKQIYNVSTFKMYIWKLKTM